MPSTLQPERWKAKFRQARRDRPSLHTVVGEADRPRSSDREHHDAECDRTPGQEPAAETSSTRAISPTMTVVMLSPVIARQRHEAFDHVVAAP